MKKGYFPETLDGIPEQKYAFVNLDFDLYKPTLAGLHYFFPRLIPHGVLLVHDYYNPGYAGISKAISDFQQEQAEELTLMPIGDHCSIAIMKNR